MAELTIEQKRLAVEKGLAQFLPETVLQRVLKYWETEYGHQPSFVLNRFLNEICTNDELRQQRKEMLRQVLHEISVVEKQQRLKVKKEDAAVIESNLNELDLFEVFYDFIMEVLKAVSRNDYLEFVEEIQTKMKKHRQLAKFFYVAGSERKCLMQMPQEMYSVMITMLYAIYCDFYGPVKADQLYAQTKNQIKLKNPDIDFKQLL